MRVAPAVELNLQQREALEQRRRARSLPARVVERARVVLLAAEGKQNKEIADHLGISVQKAARWRARFLMLGVSGIEKSALERLNEEYTIRILSPSRWAGATRARLRRR